MPFRKHRIMEKESQKALAEATLKVEEIKSRSVEVSELAGALRRARQKNHFAEQIVLIMGKKV